MRGTLIRVCVVALAVLLQGCAGLGGGDASNGYSSKLPPPNPETDCQVRVGDIEASAQGVVARGRGSYAVVTIIGVDNCPDQLPVPGMIMLQVRPRATAPSVVEDE